MMKNKYKFSYWELAPSYNYAFDLIYYSTKFNWLIIFIVFTLMVLLFEVKDILLCKNLFIYFIFFIFIFSSSHQFHWNTTFIKCHKINQNSKTNQLTLSNFNHCIYQGMNTLNSSSFDLEVKWFISFFLKLIN